MSDKKLQRSSSNRMIAGVCGGIAEYFDWDINAVRLAFLALIVLFGGGIWFYLILWLIMPMDNEF